MRRRIFQEIEIPESVNCEYSDKILRVKKSDSEISKDFSKHALSLDIRGNKIIISHEKANRKDAARLSSVVKHIKNVFRGIEEKFFYELEICNVHFPMTVKVEDNKLVIGNFLGEKERRFAKILEGAEVEVKGQKVIVSSIDVEIAGQTAANIEKATRVPKKDRRIFQDGIFMVSKKGRNI